MPTWITRERVLAAISILAFIMSISTWVHMWLYQRRNLRLSIIHYYKAKNYHYFLFSFENLSRLPILISRLEIISKSKHEIQCSLTPILVTEKKRTSGKEIISRSVTYSAKFPLPVSSLGGVSEYVCFIDDNNLLEENPLDWNFQVYTNRGKVFQQKLPYIEPAHLNELLW